MEAKAGPITFAGSRFIIRHHFYMKEGGGRKNKRRGCIRMTREMEYAKCIAIICKLFRMGKITEAEIRFVKDRLKSRYLILEDTNEAA